MMMNNDYNYQAILDTLNPAGGNTISTDFSF